MRSRHLVAAIYLAFLILMVSSQRSNADDWTVMTITVNPPDVDDITGLLDLYSLWGVRDNNIFATGESGKIIHHTSGDTWAKMSSGINDNLYTLWGTYGTLEYNNALIYLFAGGANNILLNSTGVIWNKIDTGAFTIRSIWGSSEADVYAVGDTGVVLHSTNAYNTSSAPTWTDISSFLNIPNNLLCIWGTSATNIYVGDSGGNIHHSTNNGSSWSTTNISASNINAIWGTSSSNIYAVTSIGQVYHFDGTNWTNPHTAPAAAHLTSIWGNSANDVFFSGYNGMIIHYDGTWHDDIASGTPGQTAQNINAIWGSTTGSVYFAGNSGVLIHFSRTADDISPLVLSAYAPSITGGLAYVNPQQLGGISIYFSESMNASTITTSTITLTDTSNGSSVSGTVTYDDSNMQGNFIPNNDLGYSKTYRLTVTTGATDAATPANPLATSYTKDFTTEPHPESGSGSSGTCFISTARM